MQNNINELYSIWCKNANEDPALVEELNYIKGNEDKIKERFFMNLTFGTAGLRGIIGAGTNRMNIYTVRQATQGLANFLNSKYKKPSVAIAFDSRINSLSFAKECARVLAANNIKVYITKQLQPTPVLSFLVRHLKCQSGIMITASHNPAKYNGFKCYGDDGCQMTDESATQVYEQIQNVDMFKDVKINSFNDSLIKSKIECIEDNLYEEYIKNVKAQTVRLNIAQGSKLKVVYTPLNGAGNKLVRRVLNEIGVYDVVTVLEQEFPDGNFPTCPYPNPEIKEALNLAIDLAKKVDADIILATDPDSDRVGIAVKNNGEYKLITGNENGIMMFDYICNGRKELNTMPMNPIVIKTIVTSEMVKKIADDNNVELIDVMTGFKWIGDQILALENKNEENRFLFGFEESYGYLSGTYVRDKDAVVASMLICEMAAYYKKNYGKTLFDVMEDLYKKYGFYINKTLNFAFEGSQGLEKMKNIMDDLRKDSPQEIAGIKVFKISDYLISEEKDISTGKVDTINLPKSNVISFALKDGSKVIVRPSGTEPKIKVYVTSVGNTLKDSYDTNDTICDFMSNLIEK